MFQLNATKVVFQLYIGLYISEHNKAMHCLGTTIKWCNAAETSQTRSHYTIAMGNMSSIVEGQIRFPSVQPIMWTMIP